RLCPFGQAFVLIGTFRGGLREPALDLFQCLDGVVGATHPASTLNVAFLLIILDGDMLENGIFATFGPSLCPIEHQGIFGIHEGTARRAELRMLGLPFAPLFGVIRIGTPKNLFHTTPPLPSDS